jgi:cell division protein FtsB
MRTQTLSFKIIFLPKFSKVSLKKFFTFQILVLLIFLFFFLVNVCSIVKENALKQKYQVEIDKLSKEIEVLEITFAKMNSFSQLENYFKKDRFVKISPNKIKYLEPSNEILFSGK